MGNKITGGKPGTRPARALPYELYVDGAAHDSHGTFELRFRNRGKAGAAFQVRFGDGVTSPKTYTIGAGDESSDTLGGMGATSYDLSVFGPNGFLRTFAGSLKPGSANVSVKAIYDCDSEGIELEIHNHSSSVQKVTIVDAYSGKTRTHHLQPHDTFNQSSDLQKSFGWYDFTVTVDSDSSFSRQLAGHVETGR